MTMTVREVCELKKGKSKAFWLCPNICKDMNITAKKFEMGLTFQSISAIPKGLLDKEAVKTFYENDALCVIWKNN